MRKSIIDIRLLWVVIIAIIIIAGVIYLPTYERIKQSSRISPGSYTETPPGTSEIKTIDPPDVIVDDCRDHPGESWRGLCGPKSCIDSVCSGSPVGVGCLYGTDLGHCVPLGPCNDEDPDCGIRCICR